MHQPRSPLNLSLEILGLETFQGRAFYMHRIWGIIDYLIVRNPATNDIVPLWFDQRDEMGEVTDPLLDRDESGVILARPTPPNERGFSGRVALGVFGTVFIAGEVTPARVHDTVDHSISIENGLKQSSKRIPGLGDIAAIHAADPYTNVELGGRDLDAQTTDRWQRT